MPVDHAAHRVMTPGSVDPRTVRMVGDVDFADVAPRARAITPVPGGIGPVTDVWLLRNTVTAAFKGARPYNQAHDRGVKLIGATAHYVTADLDEGPIIEQEVARVSHAMTAAQVTALGRDTECLALARTVRWHTENRVLLDRKRTVVFS